jgi:nicotinate phosphoribosyltransferase
VGQELAVAGHRLRGVRLDSGDLIELSFAARAILDDAGLADAIVFASGSVDEHLLAGAVARGAPIAAFGVGTRVGVSADAPYLDMAYKLVAYGGRPVLKLSSGKATWPGAKQVWRRRAPDGAVEDWIGLADEPAPAGGQPLLALVMCRGRRLGAPPLTAARAHAQQEVAALPAAYRVPRAPATATIHFSERLVRLRDQIAERIAHVP